MHRRNAVVLFSKPSQINRGTQDHMFAALPWIEIDALFNAMFDDIVDAASKLENTDIVIFRDQTEFSDDFVSHFLKSVRCKTLHGETFADQVLHAVEEVLQDRYVRVVVMTENNPLIRTQQIKRVFDQLKYEDDCVVVGQTFEGNTYLVGMKANHSALFGSDEGDPFANSTRILERTCLLNAVVIPTCPMYSIVSADNLVRLKNDLEDCEAQGIPVPKRTYSMFKMLEKKYKPKKVAR